MGEESARLKQEIEEARGDLARDVDLLTEKTSPSRIVGRRVEATKSGLASIKDKVMGTTSDLGHTGHGHASSAAGAVQDASRSVQNAAGNLRDKASDAVSGAASGAASAVADAGSVIGDAAHGVVSGTQTVAERARSGTQGHPLIAGGVAFGIGYLISSLLPASDAERQAAASAKDAVQEYGQPVIAQAKEAASSISHQVADSAKEHAQQLKEHAQDSVETVKVEAADAAGTVKSDVQQHADEVRGEASDLT